jgi:hypothetical protein
MYCRYFEVVQWGHLVIAAERSAMNSPMDEMVQLLDESKITGPLFPAPGVRPVVFVDLEQIPHLLATAHPLPVPTVKPRVQVSLPGYHGAAHDAVVECRDSNPLPAPRSSVEHGLLTYHGRSIVSAETSDKDIVDADTTEDVEEQNNTEQLEPDASVDVDSLAHSMDSAKAQEDIVVHSDGQIEAARVIQAMYRRNAECRGGSARSSLSEAKSRLFIGCLAECEKLKWPRSHYRLLFLGPLPHLLACLERANTFPFEAKTKVKKRLTTAEHLELEDVQMKMTEAK